MSTADRISTAPGEHRNMTAPVVIREATVEDRLALWDWRNDPITRIVSDLDKSITYDHHRRWFERLSHTEDIVLCVGLVETLRIGCVRFDRRAPENYHVSLYIKPLYCGKEFGVALLGEAIEYLRKIRVVSRIDATVTRVNPLSGRLFERLGFTVKEQGGRLDCELSCEQGSSVR